MKSRAILGQFVGLIVFTIISFLLLNNINLNLEQQRASLKLRKVSTLSKGKEYFLAQFLGDFNAVFVDLLYLKVDTYWHQGRWFRVFPLLKTITLIQPDFLEAWSLAGWHLAFNMSEYAAERKEAKRAYIDQGLAFLFQGIEKNPDKYNLYFDVAWIYYHRLKDYHRALAYFRQATKYPHPKTVERMIAHCYKRLGAWDKCLGAWQEYLEKYPEDEIGKRNLEWAQEAWEKTQANTVADKE